MAQLQFPPSLSAIAVSTYDPDIAISNPALCETIQWPHRWTSCREAASARHVPDVLTNGVRARLDHDGGRLVARDARKTLVPMLFANVKRLSHVLLLF
jgi:hypothetical protein